MKIVVYADNLSIKGGGTRAVIELANQLGANIITAGYNPEINNWLTINNNVIDLGNLSLKFHRSLGYLVETPVRFLLNKKNFEYDIHIFTGVSSYFAAKRDKKNIWLCFSPNRIIYDLHEWKINESTPLKKFFFKLYSSIIRPIDQKYIKEYISTIVSQTNIISERVNKYYKRDSIIINTAVNTSKYRFNKFGSFFLTVSRLMSEKRISLIVKAFKKMPKNKLVIVGRGPERDNILRNIRDNTNIKLLENIDEKNLLDLYADCFATIYMPKEEDYGLVPIEGMASGKPCIAVNEGGCKETIINGQTGFLIPADENAIQVAVRKLNLKCVTKMKNKCIAHSKKFDTQSITTIWNELLVNQMNIKND